MYSSLFQSSTFMPHNCGPVLFLDQCFHCMCFVVRLPCSEPSVRGGGMWRVETPHDPEPRLQGEMEAPTH